MQEKAIFWFMYSSTLSPDHSSSFVGEMVSKARRSNQSLELTGLLIFDGRHFCQYLEGPEVALDQMLAHIKADTRHCAFQLQHHGPLNSPRQFNGWSIAYAEMDEQSSLEQLAKTQGAAALNALKTLLPEIDYY